MSEPGPGPNRTFPEAVQKAEGGAPAAPGPPPDLDAIAGRARQIAAGLQGLEREAKRIEESLRAELQAVRQAAVAARAEADGAAGGAAQATKALERERQELGRRIEEVTKAADALLRAAEVKAKAEGAAIEKSRMYAEEAVRRVEERCGKALEGLARAEEGVKAALQTLGSEGDGRLAEMRRLAAAVAEWKPPEIPEPVPPSDDPWILQALRGLRQRQSLLLALAILLSTALSLGLILLLRILGVF